MNRLDQDACEALAEAALRLPAVDLYSTASFQGRPKPRPDPGATYVDVLVVVPANATRLAAIGSDDVRTSGTLLMFLRVPSNKPIANAMDQADAIAVHVNANRVGTDILFSAPTVVRGAVFKTYRLITVSTPWQSWRSAAA